ncbi:MAG TPA: DNA polymerase III subunit gamma and tau [Dermatophilaceae bacterium]|nr:DNA polymerase III subunit gamma and tau [Dermatophilaceae bacterium]
MTLALYRRYRPESFADVIGQEHVTQPLMQALRTGRVNHAYLFSGPRGCGKTTSARILARCLNCAEGPTPQPCGSCESCLGLARGGPGTVDVIEIDAASHGGVDDARDLRERASYGPAVSRYKVYIIDEAHMVTPQGFNALLKVVEEPPEHVKFVFATTEPERVIGTIRSRTHHYPFRLVPPLRLQEYLQQVCDAEGVAVAAGVLSFVVRAGGGSVRDSLSVLDQLIAGSDRRGLTYEGAAALLGFTEVELLDAVVEGLAAGDAAAVFGQVDKVIESGHDPRRFVEDVLERLRDLIVVAAVPDGGASVLRGVPEDQLERMRSQAAAFGPGALSRAADIVNAGLTEMTGATAPRLQLELICARVLLPGASGESGYAARLDRLERRLEMGGPVPPGSARAPAPAAPQPAGVPKEDPAGSAARHHPRLASPALARAAPGASEEASERGSERATERTSDPASRRASERGADPASRRASPRATPEASPGAAREASTGAAPEVSPGGAGEASTGAATGAAREGSTGAAQAASALPGEPVTAAASVAAPPTVSRAAGRLDTEAIRRSWPDVLAKIYTIRRVTWTFLSEHARVLDYDGDRLLLGIATVGLTNTFRSGQHAEMVRQALIEVLGVDTRVEGTVDVRADGRADGPIDGRAHGPAHGQAHGPADGPGEADGPGAAAGQPPTGPAAAEDGWPAEDGPPPAQPVRSSRTGSAPGRGARSGAPSGSGPTSGAPPGSGPTSATPPGSGPAPTPTSAPGRGGAGGGRDVSTGHAEESGVLPAGSASTRHTEAAGVRPDGSAGTRQTEAWGVQPAGSASTRHTGGAGGGRDVSTRHAEASGVLPAGSASTRHTEAASPKAGAVVAPADAEVSLHDEDIAEAGEAGEAVVQRLLGGTVIGYQDE